MNDHPQQPDATPPSDADLPNDAATPRHLHEHLVAYLDGELSDAAVREVEQQLARNPELRRNAEAYEKTWELLDELPQMRATDEFTTKTIASLNIKPLTSANATRAAPPTPVAESLAINTVETGASRVVVQPTFGSAAAASRTRFLPAAVWFAGLALSAVVGFLLTNRLVPSRSERLIRDLPVIEYWDKFEEAGSLEFLKRYRDLKQRGGTDELPP